MPSIHNFRATLCTAALFLSAIITPVTGQAAQNQLALVNEVPITQQDVLQEAGIIAADIQLRNMMWTRNQISKLDDQVLETLIDRELLYQKARERNIEIRTQWIERAYMDLRSKIGSTAAFESYLEKIGLTDDQLRDRIQKGLIVRRLIRRDALRRIKVSEAEMQAFYRRHPEFFIRKDQARFRQIFIAVPEADDASARGAALLRMQAIQDRLRQGANFAVLALEQSEDPSRAQGGDLGYVERTQLIPSIAGPAFELQPGQISEILESRLGYHLFEMVDRIPSSQMAYRNTRTKIERTLRRNKEKAAAADYLARLRRQAVIKR